MQKVYLGLYKGPTDDFLHTISHWVTCAVLTIRDMKLTKYSHTEIFVDSTAYSSSVRDGGVRSKSINMYSGKWDYIDITDDLGKDGLTLAMSIFKQKEGREYDWFGALGFGIPFLKQDKNKEYCFEINAEMLGLQKPHKYTPNKLIQLFGKNNVIKG